MRIFSALPKIMRHFTCISQRGQTDAWDTRDCAQGIHRAPPLTRHIVQKEKAFFASLVDSFLFCGMIGAHSSSWGGVPLGSSRHASDAEDAFTHTFVR